MRGAITLLLRGSVAAYCDGHAEALTLPTREPVPIAEVERLAQDVAEHLTDDDFVEPEGLRLRLSVRGDLLYIRGVVNRRSSRRVHEALLSAPDVRVVVLTYVPGSADDITNLELGLMLGCKSRTERIERVW